MFKQTYKIDYNKPLLYFCIGFCVVLMGGWIPVVNGLDIYMHFWRVEVAASLFLLITLSYLLFRHSRTILPLCISRLEINLIILPMLAFIVWSGLSIIWSPSWKSALYHTLIWTEYLIFHLIIRHILESAHSYKLLITLLSVMLLIIALPAIIEYGSFMYFGGATSLGIRYSKYGEVFLALFPLITVGVLRSNGRRFLCGLFVTSVICLFIISTIGRTNLMLFICGTGCTAGCVFLFKRFHRYRRKMASIILAMVVFSVPLHLISLFSDNKPNVPIVGRFQDADGINVSNDFRKLTWRISLEMIETHPIIGVGADNFGMQFNNYREIYAAKNPIDVNLATAENELAERSHNEFLQVFAELGIVGGLIFLCFLGAGGLMLIHSLKRFRQTSLFSLAALLGLFLFLLSSIVSSFSFRLMQNGFVFFFVLAVAAKSLLASKPHLKSSVKIIVSANRLKLGYAWGIAACLLLTVYCSIRVASSYYIARANQTADIEHSKQLYQTAFWLDDENPDAYYYYGMRLLKANRYEEAVTHLTQSIKGGLAASTNFSYLATAQSLAGDSEGAEQSFAEAVKLYPVSPFVRVRYASLLKAVGKTEESEEQFKYALKINPKQAKTWRVLINEGSLNASRQAFQDKSYAGISDLAPADSVSAVITEREARFPAEKSEKNYFRFDN